MTALVVAVVFSVVIVQFNLVSFRALDTVEGVGIG